MNALVEHGFGDSHDSWADRNARRDAIYSGRAALAAVETLK